MFIWTLPFILLVHCAKKAVQKPKVLQKSSVSVKPQSVKKVSEHPKKPEVEVKKKASIKEKVKTVEKEPVPEKVQEEPKVKAPKTVTEEKPVVKEEKEKEKEKENPLEMDEPGNSQQQPQPPPIEVGSPVTNLTQGFSDVYKLDNTQQEENCPVINGLVIHYIAENNQLGLILDPRKVEYLGNIDKNCLQESNKLTLYNEMASAIHNPKDAGTVEKSGSVKKDRKVVFKEGKCKLYEVDEPYEELPQEENEEDK